MNWEKLKSAALFLAVVVGFFWVVRRHQESPLIGEQAPDFALPVAAGEGAETGDRLRLSDLKGQVVVLDFWASWCGPCRDSVPELSELSRRFAGQGVRFIGINGEALAAPLYPAIKGAWKFGYPLVRDDQNTAHLAYQVQAFPSLFVIDRTQKVRYAVAGVPTKAQLEREITNVLK
jgi:thiol-disulfide isomerase/thioredoxin